ncbi:hypothetical protein [Aquimonas sp.]|jgi:hypothetical protein|uniref:hypothetical protein n=1 Tax=Aquimonas sp. TaxID=1872588 RepID=UPI0037BED574
MTRSIIAVAALLLGSFVAPPASADAKDEVVAAWERALAHGSYRMQMETETRGRVNTQQMDVKLPGSFHMRSPESEMILLPQGTWMKVNGSWMQFPMNMSKIIEGYTADAIEQGKASLTDVEHLGEAEVEGCLATRYRYSTSGKFMGMKNDSEVEMAVCQASGLPRLLTSRSGSKRRPDTLRIVYDFEAEIDIRAPR